MTRLLIAGCRDFTNYEEFKKIVDEYLFSHYYHNENATIISGGAPGTDTMAKRYANEHGFFFSEYHANWSIGKKAGPMRNKQMAENCNAALLFWDSKSSGTKNMLGHLNRLSIPTEIKYIGDKK